MIIDNFIETEPRAWVISKVNRLTAKGVVHITFAQDRFNQELDFIEKDEDGNIVGMWADYYAVPQVTDYDVARNVLSLSYKGVQNGQIKIGGNARTIIATYDRENISDGKWEYYIDDTDASSLIEESVLDDYTRKIKFIGDKTYINKKLIIRFSVDDITTQLIMNIIGL